MCNLSLGIREDGIIESTVSHIKSLMKKMPNINIQEAMDLLEVEEELRERVLEELEA